jgi:hypothetical protein
MVSSGSPKGRDGLDGIDCGTNPGEPRGGIGVMAANTMV